MSFRLSATKSLSLLPSADDLTGDALNKRSLEYSWDFSCAEHLERDWLLKASASKELFIIKKRYSNDYEREKELKSVEKVCCNKR